MSLSNDAVKLLDLLENGVPPRDVYAAGGSWWVTHGGGQVTHATVEELVSAGLIVRSFSNSDDMYHCGKTIDIEATLAEAKTCPRVKDAPLVFTDGTRQPR